MESFPGHDLIWTGSYTADSGGSATGIGAVTTTADGTLRWLGDAAAADSPSFLAVHPSLPVVYAVAEQARTVRAYRHSGGFGLVPAGPAWPAGEAACHVAVDPSGRFLVVCCWGDGQVLFYELDGDGGILDRAAAAPSRDPYGDAPGGGTPAQPRPRRAHAGRRPGDDHRSRSRPAADLDCPPGPGRGWFWIMRWSCPRAAAPAPGPAPGRACLCGDRVFDRGGGGREVAGLRGLPARLRRARPLRAGRCREIRRPKSP